MHEPVADVDSLEMVTEVVMTEGGGMRQRDSPVLTGTLATITSKWLVVLSTTASMPVAWVRRCGLERFGATHWIHQPFGSRPEGG